VSHIAPFTFGIKFCHGAQNVPRSLSRTDLEDIHYQSAKNLELQEGLPYQSVAIHDQAVQEKENDHKDQEVFEDTKIDVIEATEIIGPKPLPKQNMLKWLQWIQNWRSNRVWMLQEDLRFQSSSRDWKRSAIAQKGIRKVGQNEESQKLYNFNQEQWERCLHAMELIHGPQQRCSQRRIVLLHM
jgi:hypothetical protein